MKPKDFYKHKTWITLSRYILLKHAKDDHTVKCVTSGKWMPCNSKESHAGHFIKVTDSWATALDELNIYPQSSSDNHFRGGRQDVMMNHIINTHGVDTLQMLLQKKHNYCKLTKVEMDLLYPEIKRKFDELVKIKGNPWKKTL